MGAAFKLETFTSAAFTASRADAAAKGAEIETLLAKARGAARAQGFEEGAAATAAAYDSDRKLVLDRIAEAIEDARFSAEDAKRAAMDALGPVIKAVAEAVAPALARAGLGAEIAAIVVDAARICDPAEIEIRVTPDMADQATDALDAAGVAAKVFPDPSLGPLQAKAAWRGGYDQIDLDASIAAAVAAIAAFFERDERTGTHG